MSPRAGINPLQTTEICCNTLPPSGNRQRIRAIRGGESEPRRHSEHSVFDEGRDGDSTTTTTTSNPNLTSKISGAAVAHGTRHKWPMAEAAHTAQTPYCHNVRNRKTESAVAVGEFRHGTRSKNGTRHKRHTAQPGTGHKRHSPKRHTAPGTVEKGHGWRTARSENECAVNGTRHTARTCSVAQGPRHSTARHSHVGARTAKIEGWTGSRSLEILETARGTTERGTNGTIQKRHRAQSKTAQLKVGVPWRNAARGTVAGDGTARKRHTAHKGPQYMVHRRLEQPTGYQYTAHIFYFEKTTPLFLTIPVRHVVFSADSQTFTRVSIYINKSTLRVNECVPPEKDFFSFWNSLTAPAGV
ncbi:hypothetical protein MGYG_09129 [Nannizzia gypsea CBS 118893]|uniref:Uncharacterized protein n=1 Tax=Arthroderma gypseum (strain ATCC MYA-4604 / CBS 118893) TaxID=535722 RepID=E4UZQ4_ARTGP|nr:hypothetical protein MGYG_09129 [Nannizzia gypsea CBS 118893]EFR03584.1 hypothetical protein MGYG_09129 [Nannizzia gypsea CBS 118893]